MSNPHTPDFDAQPLTDLEQPLQELRPEEAEDVAGGQTMPPRSTRAEVPDDSPEAVTLNYTKVKINF